jgi:hypothetical protein
LEGTSFLYESSVVPRKPYENCPASIVPFTSQTALADTGIDPSSVSLTPKVNLYTPFCGTLAVVNAAAAKAIMLALARIPVFNFMDDSP